MPESVTDRPTKSHEHIFLLTKAARYFYDAEAVREKHKEPHRSGKHESTTPHTGRLDGGEQAAFTVAKREYNPAGRSLRDTWSMATQACSYSHYATFPEELPKKCILAGTSSRGCCPTCGAPWARVVEKLNQKMHWKDRRKSKGDKWKENAMHGRQDFGSEFENTRGKTLGFRPSCECGGEPIPATVLDPFSGTGTTGKVALDLGRNYIGIEINPKDIEYSRKRLTKAARQTSLPLEI